MFRFVELVKPGNGQVLLVYFYMDFDNLPDAFFSNGKTCNSIRGEKRRENLERGTDVSCRQGVVLCKEAIRMKSSDASRGRLGEEGDSGAKRVSRPRLIFTT